jgi:hypothetical protein
VEGRKTLQRKSTNRETTRNCDVIPKEVRESANPKIARADVTAAPTLGALGSIS